MDELDETIGEAHARSATLELEPVLVGFLSEAALHLFEGVAEAADAAQEIETEVEPKCSKARVALSNGRAEELLVDALETLGPVI